MWNLNCCLVLVAYSILSDEFDQKELEISCCEDPPVIRVQRSFKLYICVLRLCDGRSAHHCF